MAVKILDMLAVSFEEERMEYEMADVRGIDCRDSRMGSGCIQVMKSERNWLNFRTPSRGLLFLEYYQEVFYADKTFGKSSMSNWQN